jgi:hypothetical protein
MVKRAAAKAGINEAVSSHWLRHAHGSHAVDRGASLPEVQATATSPPRRVICTPGPTRRVACTWIKECFFADEEGNGQR